MPKPLSYDTRTHMALRDIARESLDVIELDELVHRVETQILEEGLQVGPRCRQRVHRAVTNLARSHNKQVKLHRNKESTIIRLTPDGVKERFMTFGTTPIYEEGSRRLKRMSRDEIEEELKELKEIIDQMQEVVREFKPNSPAANEPASLIDEVRDAMENVKLLGEQGTALYSFIGENAERERYMKGLLRESLDGADQAGTSTRST